MKIGRVDIWRRALKQYLIDEKYLEGPDPTDDKWTWEYQQAWHSFCIANEAKYTPDPDPINQPEEVRKLFELLYEYEVLLRTERGIVEKPVKHLIGDAWVKSRMPDPPRPKPGEDEVHSPDEQDLAQESRRAMESAIASALKRKKPATTSAPAGEEDDDGPQKKRSSKLKKRSSSDDTPLPSVVKTRG